MGASLRKPLFRVSRLLGLALCAGLAACASVAPSDAPSLTKASPLASAAARNTAIVGKTKGEVLAALGKTVSVPFDSGYEIWVYHLREGASQRTASQAEFVVLFDPSGVATKTRVRPVPAPSEARASR